MTAIDRAREAAILSAQGPFGNAGPKQIIAAYEAALSAEGMVVVPKAPTVGMLKALTASWPQNDTSRQAVTRWALGSFAEDYAAMIAAASQGEGT